MDDNKVLFFQPSLLFTLLLLLLFLSFHMLAMYIIDTHMLLYSILVFFFTCYLYTYFKILVVYFDGVIIHKNTICKYYSHVYMYIICKNIFQKKYENAKYLIPLPKDKIWDLIKMRYYLRIGVVGHLTPSLHITKLPSLRSLVQRLLIYLNLWTLKIWLS